MRSRANKKSALLTKIGGVREELKSLACSKEVDGDNNVQEVSAKEIWLMEEKN